MWVSIMQMVDSWVSIEIWVIDPTMNHLALMLPRTNDATNNQSAKCIVEICSQRWFRNPDYGKRVCTFWKWFFQQVLGIFYVDDLDKRYVWVGSWTAIQKVLAPLHYSDLTTRTCWIQYNWRSFSIISIIGMTNSSY